MAVLLLVAEVGTTTQLDCAQPLPLPSMSRILHVTNFTCHKFSSKGWEYTALCGIFSIESE